MIAVEALEDFQLSPGLEAHEPPEARGLARDEVRLLVSRRSDDSLKHARFRQLPEFLERGDLLVVNASATLPAALAARKNDGTPLRLHVSTRLPGDLWIVEPRETQVAEGESLSLGGGGSVKLLARYLSSQRLWIAAFAMTMPLLEYLQRWGQPIGYAYLRGTWPLEYYQTVYAQEPGSAEMPSAGRPFSAEVLNRLQAAGVRLARVLLHTGVASLERDEPPPEEWYRVPPEAAAAVEAAKRSGHRVIAVGTTAVRALESAADSSGRVIASSGWTNLVITPERGVRVINALLTGFHEPKSTHLALLEAVAARGHIERAYRAAVQAGYLWHEFGDIHLIL